MIIRYTEEFKMGYLGVIVTVGNPARLNRNIKEVVQALESGHKVPPGYTVNRIKYKGLREWYNCYLYITPENIIILQYKITQGTYIDLLRIDPMERFVEWN